MKLLTKNNPDSAGKDYWPVVIYKHFSNKEYVRTIELCQFMLEREPNLIPERVMLAQALYHTDRHQQAHNQFLQVLKSDSKNLVAMKYLGDILFQNGERAAAITYYRRVMNIDPRCRGLYCPARHLMFS